ncbi:hypothetical protein PENSPDRAFT_690580 [Peniophora sp. CONT]|nr:hypothetical protein PENSPDRAFT_690580 [Peniophora sp. CONT]
MVRLRGIPQTATKSTRLSFFRKCFWTEIRRRSRPVDAALVARLRQCCRQQGHTLIGPLLQYHEDGPDRGRLYVMCNHDHPEDSCWHHNFEYVSKRLPYGERLQLEDRRVVLYAHFMGTTPTSNHKLQPTLAYPMACARWVAPRPVRARSPSVEIIEAPPSFARARSLSIEVLSIHAAPPPPSD